MSPAGLARVQGDGWLAGRDPRLRILGAVAFALVTVSRAGLPAALCALAAALLLAAWSGLSPALLARRLLGVELFMAVLLLSLPFTLPGQPLFTLGTLAASREGVHAAFLILLKANAVVLALLALVGTLEPVVLGHALGRLRVPEKLVHLLLLTVRQIHLLQREFLRLRQAMRARAFVPRSDRHTWNSYGQLVGMLLVRSLERSRRTLAAMRCRGFHGRFYLLDESRWRTADSAVALLLLVLLGGLFTLDRLP